MNSGEKIKVLYLQDLEHMMKYVDEKFALQHQGKNNKYYVLYDGYKPTYTYICSTCGKEFKRDRLIKTNKKFCSRSCAGKFGRPANKDYVDIEYLKNTDAKEVPGCQHCWFNSKDEMFFWKPNNKILRLKLQIDDDSYSYYLIKRKRFNIFKLRILCGF